MRHIIAITPRRIQMAMNTLATQPKSTVSASGGFELFRVEPEEKGKYPLPIGKVGCLNNLSFSIAGVPRSLYTEQVEELIKKYGGSVTGAVSSKTSYLVLGKEAGKMKVAAAAKHGTKIIDEKALFNMISDSKVSMDDDLAAALNQVLPTEGKSWKKMTKHVFKTICREKSSKQYKDAETYKPTNLEAIELLDFALKNIRDIWCERGKEVVRNSDWFEFSDADPEEESDDTSFVFSDEKQIKEWVNENVEMNEIYSDSQIVQEYRKIEDRRKEEQLRIEMEIQTKEEELAALRTKRSQL